jgi:hypothetical protein
MEQAPVESLPPPVPPPRRVPHFDPPNVLWYFGAIAATVAAAAVVGDTGSAHRGIWIFAVAFLFTFGAAVLSAFARRLGCRIPAGVMATSAVALAPLVLVGIEHLIGVWPKSSSTIDAFHDFEGVPFSLALVTVSVALFAFWVVRFGFIMLPLVVSLELALQFFLPAIVTHPGVEAHEIMTIFSGVAFVVIGMLLDARGHREVAFWWHVLGLTGIAEGLTYYAGTGSLPSPISTGHHSWAWVTMLVVGVVLVVAAFPVRRATWAAFGVLGIYAPAVHYIDDWTGSWHIALVLVFVGIALVFLGAILDTVDATDWPAMLARPPMLRRRA